MKENLKIKKIARGPARIVLDLEDLRLILHRSKTTAWRMMKQIREKYEKPPKGPVTIKDLSRFTGMAMEEIKEIVINRDEPFIKSPTKQ